MTSCPMLFHGFVLKYIKSKLHEMFPAGKTKCTITALTALPWSCTAIEAIHIVMWALEVFKTLYITQPSGIPAPSDKHFYLFM